jgi:hypothetical protein
VFSAVVPLPIRIGLVASSLTRRQEAPRVTPCPHFGNGCSDSPYGRDIYTCPQALVLLLDCHPVVDFALVVLWKL